jgi:hypothetical protein
MKRDLLVAAIVIAVSALGIGLVAVLPFLQNDDDGTLIKPKPEPIAEVKKIETPVNLGWHEKKQREIKKPAGRKKEEKKTITPEIENPGT